MKTGVVCQEKSPLKYMGVSSSSIWASISQKKALKGKYLSVVRIGNEQSEQARGGHPVPRTIAVPVCYIKIQKADGERDVGIPKGVPLM